MRGIVFAIACALLCGCGPTGGIRHGGSGGSGGSGGGGSGGSGGGSGGSGGPTFAEGCNGAATTITGAVLAPNGHDPVANAFAYVAVATTPFTAGVACELCNAPVDAAAATTTTDANGTFTLDLGKVSAAATVRLTVNKGRFRRTTTIAVTACAPTAAAAAATTLPGKTASGDDIPKIAVASGNKDQLDVVLAAMGLDAQQGFDCFEGRASASSTLKSPCGMRGGLMPIESLLKDEPTLEKYNLLFLSCAPGKFAALAAADQQTIVGNLRSWTQKGGRLFATDNSYDYLAQAFPSAAMFLNGNASVAAANAGVGTSGAGSQYAGRVNDTTLATWLGVVGAIPPGTNAVTLTGYLNKWSVVESVPMSTVDVVDATNAQAYPAGSTTAGPATTYPQTIRFDVSAPGASAACGRGIYTSYHTLSGTTSGTALAPQERILEYLMLEAGACVGPIS
jgi:hypothetical protein